MRGGSAVNNDSRPLFQHGTLSAVDDAVTLRHATLPQLAADLRRRAREYEEGLFANGTAPGTGGVWRPQWAGMLRRMARRLEANAPT